LAAPIPVRAQTTPESTPHPILFVTQMPISADFAAIGSVFANHRASIALSGRGGDLYIRYPDGSLRNLTREAGFGTAGELPGRERDRRARSGRALVRHQGGLQHGGRCADPAVRRRQQLLAALRGQRPGPGPDRGDHAGRQQPADFNNIQPAYGSDGAMIFASDRPAQR
jgi:hypothetical protein